ncbi:COQ9 Ubiquinone biosynthesis protein COQ9 [Candida maltosa Xu316]
MLSRSLRITQRTTIPSLVRTYYSTDHINSNVIVNESTIDSQILNQSIKYIPEYGFNSKCITKAIHDLKYPDSLHSVITMKGKDPALVLILYWLRLQRAKLEKYVNDPETSKSFHELTDEYQRLSHLIKVRLSYNVPVLGKLHEGLSQLVVPFNLSDGMNEIYELSDDLAFYAGDKSNDFSWYSKRLGVSTIYVSSELYMLNDKTRGFENTRKFVDDKVADLKKLGNGYNDVEQWLAFNGISLINLIKSQLTRG